jgi:hypothetical protein
VVALRYPQVAHDRVLQRGNALYLGDGWKAIDDGCAGHSVHARKTRTGTGSLIPFKSMVLVS